MLASVRKQIDAHLAEIVRQTQELEQFLWAASAAALEHDVKQTIELRERGLVLGTEVPLGPSQLRLDPAELSSSRFGGLGANIVTARQIMAEHEYKAAVRSGNAGVVGQQAPDFFTTKGDPAYLKSTASQVWPGGDRDCRGRL